MSSVRISRWIVLVARSVENVSTGPAGCWRIGMNVAMSAITSATLQAADEAGQVEPVRADVADGAKPAAGLRFEAPVPVSVVAAASPGSSGR